MASLSQIEKTIAKYDAEAPNIQENIKKKINEQFNYGKPWLENIATWERNILPAFYEQFAQTGTGAADLSPAQQMLLASKNVARSGATADVARGIYGKQQQREGEMLRDMLQAWQLARQGAVDAWTRQFSVDQANRASRTPANPWDNFDFTGDDPAATGGSTGKTGSISAGTRSGGKSLADQLLGAAKGGVVGYAKQKIKDVLPDKIEGIGRNLLNLFRK